MNINFCKKLLLAICALATLCVTSCTDAGESLDGLFYNVDLNHAKISDVEMVEISRNILASSGCRFTGTTLFGGKSGGSYAIVIGARENSDGIVIYIVVYPNQEKLTVDIRSNTRNSTSHQNELLVANRSLAEIKRTYPDSLIEQHNATRGVLGP